MKPIPAEFRHNRWPLLGSAIGLACGVNAYAPVSSMFLRQLEREFGWTKTAAAASLLALPLMALALPLVGGLLDRYGVRRPALASAITLALCLLLLSMMNGSLSVFYGLFLAMMVFGCATGPIAYTRNIAASFQTHRGSALALALIGTSMAAMLLPPLLAGVMAQRGWRGGFQLLAVLALVGGGLAFALIRDPVQRGEGTARLEGLTLRQAVRTTPFWVLCVGVLLISTAAFGFVSHLQSIVEERGLPAGSTPQLISTISFAVLVSRLVVGSMLDRFPPQRIASLALLVAASGFSVWWFSGASTGLALVAALLIGTAIGAELDFLSFFCARHFGVRHYGQIYGCASIFFNLGIALGGLTFGLLHDASGHYENAVVFAGVLLVLASAAFAKLGHHTHTPIDTNQ